MRNTATFIVIGSIIITILAAVYGFFVLIAIFLQYLINITFEQSYDYNVYLLGLILFIISFVFNNYRK